MWVGWLGTRLIYIISEPRLPLSYFSKFKGHASTLAWGEAEDKAIFTLCSNKVYTLGGGGGGGGGGEGRTSKTLQVCAAVHKLATCKQL